MSATSFAFSKKIQKPMSDSEAEMFDIGGLLVGRLYPGMRKAESAGVAGGFFRETNNGIAEFWFQFCYCDNWDSPIQDFTQLKTILDTVKKICLANVPIETFYLIVASRFQDGKLKNSFAQEVRETLGSRAIEIEVFDLEDFLKFVFEQVDVELRDNILDANQRFFEEYRERMEQLFYLPDVPFSANSGEKKVGPMIFLDEVVRVQEAEMAEFYYALKQQGKYTPTQKTRPKCFIVSEFGFGKTSLLLQYTARLREKRMMPVYVPMSLLPPRAFDFTILFARAILEMILEEELSEEDLFDGLRIRAFKKMMQVRTDIVLLLDGLDEHPAPYHPNGLTQIAACLEDFKTPCVFSVRKEFWDARRERFEEAFRLRRKPSVKIELLEWTDDVILDFLDAYGAHTDSLGTLFGFRELVQAKRYEQFYGDIPKRPLFLEMLVRDVVSGEFGERNLAQLYEGYFREKFHLGRKTFFEKNTRRPMPVEEGVEKVIDKMLWVMEYVAAEMLSNDEEGNVEFLNQIAVSKIEHFWQEAGIQDDLAFFLHSVLITFGKHDVTGLKVKFAHKSFQEYFVARYLTKILLDPTMGTSRDFDWFNRYGITDGVPQFMKGIVETLERDEQDACLQSLRKLNDSKAPGESIAGRFSQQR